VSHGFSFRATPKGTVFIERDGERVKTLRADRARRFLAMAHSTDRIGQQQLMARTADNDKQGSGRGE
jgi:hypothetical protein